MGKQPVEPKIKIRVIEFRTHVHATESLDVVMDGILNLLPEDFENFEKKEIELDNLSSIFNTPIRGVTITISKQKRIKAVLAHIAKLMPQLSKDKLESNIERRINDKNRLFFRLDKQYLVNGKLRVMEGSDCIQIMIAPINKNPMADFTKSHIKEFFKEKNLI